MIERGAEIKPNSIIPPGRLIPAGQLWGGSPIRYVRELTEEEKVANYNESYSKSVKLEEGESDQLWPEKYLEKMPEGVESQETIEEYVEDHYFKKGLYS